MDFIEHGTLYNSSDDNTLSYADQYYNILINVLEKESSILRERPFNLKGGGYGFFLKKYSDSQCCWKKYSDFGEGKKNNLIQSFCHITYCWILEKKFATKKNILTLVLSKKKFWTKQKTITPPSS